MNLIEAVSSGLPFKRKYVKKWITWEYGGYLEFDKDAIVATDYEVKKEPREWWLIPCKDGFLVGTPDGYFEGPKIRVREVLE